MSGHVELPSPSPSPASAGAFLSSPSGMRDTDGGPNKEGLRFKAWSASRPGRLFVAECNWKGFRPGERVPELTVATTLMEQIRASKRFICLLVEASNGSRLRISETPVTSTFFELEIFQSIVLTKPTYLLIHRSFDAGAIEPYLDLLGFAFPDWRSQLSTPLSDAQALRAIEDISNGAAASAQWRVPRTQEHAAQFHHALMRSRDQFLKRESKPIVHFLNLGRQAPQKGVCDLAAVQSLLLERDKQSTDVEVNNDRRLAISWLLLRELSVAPLLNEDGEIIERDPYLLSAWNLALSDWHNTASWGSLHSNIYIGTLSTLGTLETVREALRPIGDRLGTSTNFPGGGYATSYYSLSKLVPPNHRLDVLALARETLLLEAGDDAKNRPGCLAMLGSFALQEGKPIEAAQLYEQALAIHTHNSDLRAMGEMLCELSLAQLQCGDRSKAAMAAAEGIRLMQCDGVPGKAKIDGFLIRAMFKAAYVQLRAMRPGGAILYYQALKLARDGGYTDQYAQWGPSGIGRRIMRIVNARIGRGLSPE